MPQSLNSSPIDDGDKIDWRNLTAAFAAVCVFSFSLGEIFPLLSLNMEKNGVDPRVIGYNAAMAPIGILLAGLIIPRLSHRFGPRRLAIFMALATGVIFLGYPSFPTLWAWFPLRLIQGVCVATLFALSEAWVIGNAKGVWRGRIVGLYGSLISGSFGVGPAIVGWVGIHGYTAFVIGAVILIVSAFPISLVRDDHNRDIETPHGSIWSFIPKAPFLLGAIVIHAMFDGGMLGFLAVYGVRHGMSVERGAFLITALACGNVFFQIPIGWIADHTSKPAVMLACFIGAAFGLMVLPFAITTVWVWPLAMLMGAFGFGIYTVGLAQLGDNFSGSDLITGTAAFSTVWGLGALLGSVLAGFAMDIWGPDGFPRALLAVFLVYIGVRLFGGFGRRAV
ncbi:MAG TPA: MFS transporter [Dongiaceae bacterium]|jgi:MFS family permease